MHGAIRESMANCPVCRKVFQVKDIEHVLDLVDTHSSQLSAHATEEDDEILHSDSEMIRKQKYEVLMNLQREKSGLIEPKKSEVLLPGVYLPQLNSLPTTTTTEPQERDPVVAEDTGPSGSTTSLYRNSGMRKQRVQSTRRQVKQWVKKDTGS